MFFLTKVALREFGRVRAIWQVLRPSRHDPRHEAHVIEHKPDFTVCELDDTVPDLLVPSVGVPLPSDGCRDRIPATEAVGQEEK